MAVCRTLPEDVPGTTEVQNRMAVPFTRPVLVIQNNPRVIPRRPVQQRGNYFDIETHGQSDCLERFTDPIIAISTTRHRIVYQYDDAINK